MNSEMIKMKGSEMMIKIKDSDNFKNKYRISSARLAGYDYGNSGFYYVTICTKNKIHYFGEIAETLHATSLQPSRIGEIANQFWKEIPEHFPLVELDEYSIMPNHMHGIIAIEKPYEKDAPETLYAGSLQSNKMSDISPKSGSLSTVIRSFKSAVTKWCNENNYEFFWQPRFHDHIIRNEKELNNIRQYIIDNPKNWNDDEFY